MPARVKGRLELGMGCIAQLILPCCATHGAEWNWQPWRNYPAGQYEKEGKAECHTGSLHPPWCLSWGEAGTASPDGRHHQFQLWWMCHPVVLFWVIPKIIGGFRVLAPFTTRSRSKNFLMCILPTRWPCQDILFQIFEMKEKSGADYNSISISCGTKVCWRCRYMITKGMWLEMLDQ